MEYMMQKMLENHREAVLYVVFGGFTTLVTWLTYMAFVWLGMDLNVSNIISWVCGVLFAFVVNKWFVFSCRSTKTPVILKELGSFFSARLLTGVVAIILFPILYGLGMDWILFGIDGLPAKMITSIIEIALNWIFSKYYIFTRKDE